MRSRSASHILIVDDDLRFLKALSAYLQKTGYQVSLARNGEQAEDLIEKMKFDIVVTDLKMPGKNGMEVLRKALEENPHCHVILMTGYGTIETAVDAIKRGAFDYKAKPFLLEEMKLAIERAEINLELISQRDKLLKEREKLIKVIKRMKSRRNRKKEDRNTPRQTDINEKHPRVMDKARMIEEAFRSYQRWQPPQSSLDEGIAILEGLRKEGVITEVQLERLKKRLKGRSSTSS
jgi:ActR/RegA family two-component response regulator